MGANKKRKVLLCAPLGGVVGGITKWTENIIDYYKGLENPNVSLCFTSMSRSRFIDTNAHLARLWIAFKDYKRIFKAYLTLLDDHVDIVHLTSSASWGLLRDYVMLRKARKKKVKTIIHFHFGRIPELSKRQNWEWRLLNRIVCLADEVIVMDRLSYETLICAGHANVTLTPNPVPLEVFEIIRNNQNCKRQPRTILFAGHVLVTKGVFELLEACKTIPDIKLKFVGHVPPDIFVRMEKSIADGGNGSHIEICGQKSYDEVIKEMLHCAVFVLPSYTEGFPNVILESMACGCPIISTAVGAIPEMLAEESGVIVAPRNAEQLHDAVLRVLNTPEKAAQMGRNAAVRVRKQYTIEAVWLQLSNLWEHI